MIRLKIYNSDEIRNRAYFPRLNDPRVLELTLLRIINEARIAYSMKPLKVFDVYSDEIRNIYFTYFSSSNFNSWGELPMEYIYNDMVRHILERNSSCNYTMTLESIWIDASEKYKCNPMSPKNIMDSKSSQAIYDIVGQYITENYLCSYNYIMTNNNGIMVAYIPKSRGVIAYIISVGFDQIAMAKWFCTGKNEKDPNCMPYGRYCSLRNIINTRAGTDINIMEKGGINRTLMVEMAEGRMRENVSNCVDLVNTTDITLFRRKSDLDTAKRKYGKYDLDENILGIYDSAIPAATCIHSDYNGKIECNAFNQMEEYGDSMTILRKQNDLIRINERRKKMGYD